MMSYPHLVAIEEVISPGGRRQEIRGWGWGSFMDEAASELDLEGWISISQAEMEGMIFQREMPLLCKARMVHKCGAWFQKLRGQHSNQLLFSIVPTNCFFPWPQLSSVLEWISYTLTHIQYIYVFLFISISVYILIYIDICIYVYISIYICLHFRSTPLHLWDHKPFIVFHQWKCELCLFSLHPFL